MPDIDPLPSMLYFADFPPSNLSGGAILTARLLAEYPQNNLKILTGSWYMKQSQKNSLLSCQHYVFFSTNHTGKWGFGRFKHLVNLISIPFLLIYVLCLIYRHSVKVIFSVAHGYFFIAAAIASKIANTPLILTVHDDWFMMINSVRFFPRPICRLIYYLTMKCARHVYAISPAMVQMLKKDFMVNAELQMPATKPLTNIDFRYRLTEKNLVKICFTGAVNHLNADAIELIIDVVTDHALFTKIRKNCQLFVYSNLSPQMRRRFSTKKRDFDCIKFFDWVRQDELPKIYEDSDILFLPLSFSVSNKTIAGTSFPTKTVDYLNARKPIVVLAPPDAMITQYAKKYGFAAVVDQLSTTALIKTIERVVNQSDYSNQLIHNAIRTLSANHNIDSQYASFCNCVLKLNK